MLYQLPNGRVIEMSTEQYFAMSDEELEYLVAYNYGDLVEDPWFGSILSKQDNTPDKTDTITDLTNITDAEKFSAPDIDFSLEEE